MTNTIGLDNSRAKDLANQLNQLLANYTVFYMNVRGFHWNIKGNNFFELHRRFEDLYGNLEKKIDEIAERILTLGYTPVHSFSDYLRMSEIREARDVTGAEQTVSLVLEGLTTVIRLQRDLLVLSANSRDEGTNTLMGDYTREQEKLCWMYSAFLNHALGSQDNTSQNREAGAAQ